jgi:large subunit ribosomal protein L34
VGNAP